MTHPFDVAAAHAKAFRLAAARRPPRPDITPAALRARFDGPTPEHGEDAASVIEALANAAEPGLMATVGPRFFGWVIGASHEAGVAADWLTSAWGQNAGVYAAAPSAAIAEHVAARWLLDILNLPAEASVGFVTGATMAHFTCLAAARSAMFARMGWDVEARGLIEAPRLRILVGEDAHATVFAALRYLGFGEAIAERVATDDQGAMRADDLSRMLAAESAPAIVIAQAGQINTGAFDPMQRIAEACRAHGAWLHVDGAFGLWACAVPELRGLTAGVEHADSWATDGHKWLQIPFDSGFAIVRDAEAHRRAMAIGASFLPVADYEPAHFTPELSRRARGFAVWAMLRTLGRTGVAELVRRHCALARLLAAQLSALPDVRIENDVVLNQVIVRFGDDDGMTRAVIDAMQADNVCFAEGARWRGKLVMRLSLISAPLAERDIERLVRAIVRALRKARAREPVMST